MVKRMIGALFHSVFVVVSLFEIVRGDSLMMENFDLDPQEKHQKRKKAGGAEHKEENKKAQVQLMEFDCLEEDEWKWEIEEKKGKLTFLE